MSCPPDSRRRRRADQRARPGRARFRPGRARRAAHRSQRRLPPRLRRCSGDGGRCWRWRWPTASRPPTCAIASSRPRGPSARPLPTPAAPRRKSRLAGLLTPSTGFAVIGVAAAIVFALIAVSQHDSASSARDDQQALVAILSAPDAHVVPLKPAGGGPSGGRMIVSRNRAALVSSLQSAPAGHTYQAWGLRPGGASPVPLPTFSRQRRRGHPGRRRAVRRGRPHGRAERRLAEAVVRAVRSRHALGVLLA